MCDIHEKHPGSYLATSEWAYSHERAHCEYHPGGVRLAVVNVESDEMYLRVERKGHTWDLFYKLAEEDEWEFLDTAPAGGGDLEYDDPHLVGIAAKTWGGNPVVADFD